MEVLEQLEVRVSEMLRKLDALVAERKRLQEEREQAVRDKEALEVENHALLEALAQEKALRAEVLQRLDALLRAVEEHDSTSVE
ncbi:cell division protein ZapB [uncultured Desulfovibrio sp.]|uniref:cell division protein ZapB n=1 Tax=uncultured Desulfovibrio sp. TaxID=167968 RepID=UPI00263A3B21|nr:cell division protein ZapB [uncultured Desulfovibrio sp.]